jgi:zinc protease
MNTNIQPPRSSNRRRYRRVLPTLILCTAIAFLTVHSGVAAQGAPAAAIQVQRLSNGLTIIVEQRPDALVTGVSLVVRAGSRDDPADRPGAVATLAGTLLQGTENHPTESSLTAEIDEIAGRIELMVDADLVHYTVQVPNGELRPVLDMLSDAMLNPRFGVIGTADALIDAASGGVTPFPSELSAALWPDHPAGRSFNDLDEVEIEEAVGAVTYRDLLTLKDRFFVASNMVLSIVGPVDAAAAVAQADQYFDPLPVGERQPLLAVQAGPPRTGRVTAPSLLNQGVVMVAFPTVGLLSPDYPAVAMLGAALGGASGRLFQDLRLDQRLAYMVDGEALAMADAGALLAAAIVGREDVEAAIERMTDVFAELRQRPPEGAELARLRQRMRGEFLIGREPAAVAADVLGTHAMLGLPIDPVEQLARYEAVTADDLRRVAGEYLLPERAVTLVMVGPSLGGLGANAEANQ